MATSQKNLFISLGIIFSSYLLASCGDANTYNATIDTFEESEDFAEDAVRIFGDSIFTSGGNMIKQELEPLIKKTITSHAVAGTVMNQIKDQYFNSKAQGMRTVIFDGGGNDVLGARGDCQSQFSPRCKGIIDGIGSTAKALFEDMAKSGVTNIVYLSCYYPINWNNGFVQAVDYGYEVVKKACEDSKAPCTIIDPRASFKGRNDLIEWDGIHPNRGGAALIAKLIWEGMQNEQMEP